MMLNSEFMVINHCGNWALLSLFLLRDVFLSGRLLMWHDLGHTQLVTINHFQTLLKVNQNDSFNFGSFSVVPLFFYRNVLYYGTTECFFTGIRVETIS